MQPSGTAFEPGTATSTAPAGEGFKRWLLHKPTRGQIAFMAGALLTGICIKGPELLVRALRPAQSAGDLASMAPGSTTDAAAIPALRGIPNVSISYYDIEATDAAGIKSELRAKSIRSGKKRYRAWSGWHYKWRWAAAPNGGCGTAGARVTFRAHVTLPRLANPNALATDVAQAWHMYMDALIRHEANHVRQAYEGRLLVAEAVRSSGCASANAAGHLAIAKVNYAAALYDERTKHGAREGAVFRPQPTGGARGDPVQ